MPSARATLIISWDAVRTKKTHKLLDWERQAVGDAVGAGEKACAVAAEFAISPARAGQIAVECGYPCRPRGRPRKNKELSRMVLVSSYP